MLRTLAMALGAAIVATAPLIALDVAVAQSPASVSDGTERATDRAPRRQWASDAEAVRHAYTVSDMVNSTDNSDLDWYVRLDTATRLIKSGASPEDVQQKVREASARVRRAVPDSDLRGGLGKSLLTTGFGAILSLVSPYRGPGIALTGAGLADLLPRLHRDAVEGIPLRRDIRRKADGVNLYVHTGKLFDEFNAAVEAREAADKAALDKMYMDLFPRARFGRTAGFDEIGRAVPEFHQTRSLLTIDDRSERTQALISEVKSIIGDVRSRTANSLGALSSQQLSMMETVESINDGIGALNDAARRQEEHRKEREKARLEKEGLRSAAYVVTTLVGLHDPDAGVKVGAMTDTAFGIWDAVDAFGEATSNFTDISGAAVAILTGDFVSAGLKLVSAFVDTGPTADELILEGISEIKQQVEEVRQQMHARFDLLDERLIGMHTDLATALANLGNQMAAQGNMVSGGLREIQSDLRSLAANLADAGSLVSHNFHSIMNRLDMQDVVPCLTSTERRESFDRREFDRCLGLLGAQANRLESEQLPELRLDNVSASDLDRLTNVSLVKFVEMSPEEDLAVPRSVVNPDHWLLVADNYDRFVGDWPEYRDQIAPQADTRYGKDMRRLRANIIRFIDSLEEDYRRFAEGGKSAIGAVFDDLRGGMLSDAVDLDDLPLRWSDRWVGASENWIDVELHDREWRNLHIENYEINDWSPFWTLGDYTERVGEMIHIRECIPEAAEPAPDRMEYEGVCADDEEPLKYRQLGFRSYEDFHDDIVDEILRAAENYSLLGRMMGTDMVDIYIYHLGEFLDRPENRIWRSDHLSGRPESISVGRRIDIELRVIVKPKHKCLGDRWEVYSARGRDGALVDITLRRLPSVIDDLADFSGEEHWTRILRGRKLLDVKEDPEWDVAFDEALDELHAELEDFSFDFEDCVSDVDRRMNRAYKDLSDAITGFLNRREAYTQYVGMAREYRFYLSSWLSILLRDSIRQSGVAEAIATGSVGLPLPDAVLREMKENGIFAWRLEEEYRRRLDRFEEWLRSPAVAAAVDRASGDADLMRASFWGIDEQDEEIGSEEG